MQMPLNSPEDERRTPARRGGMEAASWPPRRWGVREVRRIRLVGSTFLLAALLMAAIGGGHAAPTATDCSLTFEPPEVRAGEAAVEVHWTATKELPEVEDVMVTRDSGLEVSLIADRPQNLEVDASEAMQGEWPITLIADERPVCEGLFYVI